MEKQCSSKPTYKGMRVRGGCHNQYYQLRDIGLQRVGKKCQTSRVTGQDDGNYDHYGSVSRGEELVFLAKSKKLNPRPGDLIGPSTSAAQPSSSSTCQANKTLDQPRINSSRFEAEAIQNAIANLANVPLEVERSIRSAASADKNSKENKQVMREATRKLNLLPTTKIYRDLLEISVVPEVNLKRVPTKERIPDPVPVLGDYMQVEFNRVQPYSIAHLIRQEPLCPPVMNDDNSNDYDIIELDRFFISQ